MSKPSRDVEIVESKTVRRVTFETDASGERVEVLGPEIPNPGPRFTVYVDGAYHGSCDTRAKAERAAKREREADETITERAVRILRDAIGDGDASPDVEWIGVQHTGGGCLAAEIHVTGERGYVMVTDPEMGYAKWSDYSEMRASDDTEGWDAPYCVGAYDQFEHTEWIESVSGGAYTDREMVEMVRKALAYLTR